MILLDTHVLLWFVQGNEKLGTSSRDRVQHALNQGKASISAISLWEISMLVDRRRLVLGRSTQNWVQRISGKGGFLVAPITAEIAMTGGQLPGDINGDPADRLIIATARTNNCPLLTADRNILAYGATGHIAMIDARN